MLRADDTRFSRLILSLAEIPVLIRSMSIVPRVKKIMTLNCFSSWEIEIEKTCTTAVNLYPWSDLLLIVALQLLEAEMPPLHHASQPAYIRAWFSLVYLSVKHQGRMQTLLTVSENRIRARASLRRIKLSICLGVAVITCYSYHTNEYDI